MEVKKIADILLNMSLGIDYRDDMKTEMIMTKR